MYDSLRIFLKTEERINTSSLEKENILRNLSTGEEITTAELGNLKITQTEWGICIKGSLPKYLLGSNIHTFTRTDTKRAIEKIQDRLSLNLQTANVYYMEIGENFIMKEPFRNYLNLLIDCPYLPKAYHAQTLYFSNKQRQVIFYNKADEMERKKEQLPKEFEQHRKNVLRYEIRYRKNIKRQFGMEIKVQDLYDVNFFSDKVLKWKCTYNEINKLQRLMKDKKNYSSSKSYKDFILLEFLNYTGIDNILNDIDANRDKFNSSVGASRCKRILKNLIANQEYSEPNDLVEELNQKINEKVEFHLSN